LTTLLRRFMNSMSRGLRLKKHDVIETELRGQSRVHSWVHTGRVLVMGSTPAKWAAQDEERGQGRLRTQQHQ
jgi:hypothetical protein